jgi:pimeloyl-ACP methyl ester carboxylesterase
MTTSDGVKIHYMVQGQGSPVVLIHGFGATADWNWFSNGIAEALAKKHRVIAIDCRGHGRSDRPYEPEKYGDRLWKDVIELMDHLGIQRAHVHGYSMGGTITAELLARHPERFITASFGGSGIPEVDPEWVAKVPKDKPGPDPQEAEAIKNQRQNRAAQFKLAGNPPPDAKALGALRKTFVSAKPTSIDLTKIQIPVLAINGEFDRPNANTVRMQRELKNFKSVVLPGQVPFDGHPGRLHSPLVHPKPREVHRLKRWERLGSVPFTVYVRYPGTAQGSTIARRLGNRFRFLAFVRPDNTHFIERARFGA